MNGLRDCVFEYFAVRGAAGPSISASGTRGDYAWMVSIEPNVRSGFAESAHLSGVMSALRTKVDGHSRDLPGFPDALDAARLVPALDVRGLALVRYQVGRLWWSVAGAGVVLVIPGMPLQVGPTPCGGRAEVSRFALVSEAMAEASEGHHDDLLIPDFPRLAVRSAGHEDLVAFLVMDP